MNKCKCDWCNNVPNRSGKGYCRRHYDQIRKYGHVLEARTRTNKNRVIVQGDKAEVIITDCNDVYKATSIIDAEDVNRVLQHRWTLSDNGYVRTYNGTNPVYLHRFLLDYDGELTVDHVNRNKLDNRKSNLRVVTQSVNNYNREAKGYSEVKRNLKKRFCAKIPLGGGAVRHVYYETAEEAHNAYEKAKQELISPPSCGK